MVYSSRFPAHFEEAQGYGWSPVQSTLDWSKLIVAVDKELEGLNGVYQGMLNRSGVEIIKGYARFIDSHTVEIGDRKVSADKILIAVGGCPVKPQNIPGIEHAIVSDNMFHLQEQPQRLVVLGGGYIGVEFACIMHGLGSEVTQIIRADKILRGFDDDLRSTLQEAMQQHGIRIYHHSQDIEIGKTPEGIKVTAKGETEPIAIADVVSLAALGRKPNIDKLALENAGVEVVKGTISVNECSQTSQENIYAVGDCTNRVNLTPVAIKEGRILADTTFGGKEGIMSYENIPSAVFSTPELATVGLTEEQAREKYGDAVKIYRAKFRPLYHNLSGQEERTLMKLIVDQNSDRVLGAHMIGEHAAEIIQGVAIAIKMGGKKFDFDTTIGIHPSAAEEFVTMR
ncbi:MAG: glutathione-disulfide reductase [Xenococcaceae cyanobacterium MO_188.B32]|nr:glutathione-disulfide reductase [Xenococcaceae cyanobacterium MO_188.B32]